MMMKGIEEGRTTVADPRSYTCISVGVCTEFTEVFGEEEQRYDGRERGRMHNRGQSTFSLLTALERVCVYAEFT
jgi:hypothetical protein